MGGSPFVAVVGSDVHIPFHSPEALSIFVQVIAELQPNVVVLNGDVMDCAPISRFDQDPARIQNLQDDINTARRFLTHLRSVVKKKRIIITAGNHEDRLQKLINSLTGPSRELAKLDSFQQSMTWPSLLRLGQLNIGWIDTFHQPATDVIPGLAIRHGSLVRKYSGYSARGEFEALGVSGTSGHTHRLGSYFHRNANGQAVWFETGALCNLSPDYVRLPNWQQGFAVVTVYPHQLPAVELIQVHNGKATFRGALYKN